MTAPGPYPPTSDLVAVAWVRRAFALVGFPDQPVGTTLPKDIAGWVADGFVQVQAIGGGTPDIDIPVRHPVVQIDCWATSAATSKSIPWGKANRLAEFIRLMTEDAQLGYYGKPVELPAEYRGAAVQAAYPLTEPMRMNGDPSGYARFTLDLAIDWKPVAA